MICYINKSLLSKLNLYLLMSNFLIINPRIELNQTIFFKLNQEIVEKNIKQDLFDRINKIYDFNKNFKN